MSIPRKLTMALVVLYLLSLVMVAARIPSADSAKDQKMSGAEAFLLSMRGVTEIERTYDVEDWIVTLAWLANLPLLAALIGGLRRTAVRKRLIVALVLATALAISVYFVEGQYLREAYFLWCAILATLTAVAMWSRGRAGTGARPYETVSTAPN